MDDDILKKILVEYPSGHEFSLRELKLRFRRTPEADLQRVIFSHLHRSDGGACETGLPVFRRIGADRYRVQLTAETINLLFGAGSRTPSPPGSIPPI